MWSSILPAALFVLPCLATVTPDNTCGGTNKYTCNPSGLNGVGGGCCSKNGYCGSSPDYCGAGCQSAFGQCFGQSSKPATKSGNKYVVQGVGQFTNFQNYTFTGNSLPAGLTYLQETDGKSPYQWQYTPNTVSISNGFLNLKVPGGQTQGPIQSAGIITTAQNIRYGSVRTYGIFSNVPGTCQTQFFYKDDNNEIDIEWLSDANSHGYNDAQTGVYYPGRPLQFTNQLETPGDPQTHGWGNLTDPDGATVSDLFTAIHEIRIDWIPGKTAFYFDGVLQDTLRHHVPQVGGEWLWQNWANGDIGWTAGPPATDSVYRISNIVMYYNQTS